MNPNAGGVYSYRKGTLIAEMTLIRGKTIALMTFIGVNTYMVDDLYTGR